MFLKGATCEIQKHNDAGMDNVFEVVAQRYSKNDKEITNQRRTFLMHAENADVAEHWVYMIRYVIERLEMDGAEVETDVQRKSDVSLPRVLSPLASCGFSRHTAS